MQQSLVHRNLLLYSLTGLLYLLTLSSCSASRKTFNPEKTYTKAQLQEDYRLFRNILEDAHPSLYWYTSKDSLDYYFNQGYNAITDSMTEPAFRTLLSYVIAKIDCGHTSVKFSKAYAKYQDTARTPQFPIGLKFWDDTAAIYTNINRADSILIRGTIVTAINNRSIASIRDSLFTYMVTDGYSLNHKYQTLSNLGSFGGLYQAVYGKADSFLIRYIDPTGAEKETWTKRFDFRSDSAFQRFRASIRRPTRKERRAGNLFATRNIQIDTAGSTAVMSLTTFANGNHLRSFFRKSFRVLQEQQIRNLVIDLRLNGGGNVALSNRLTQYITDHRFRLSDSLYAVRRLSHYERHINNTFAALFFMELVTRKRSDGLYHFGYFERHYFKPKKAGHYNGNVYVLTGGNTFSASTLFVHALKGQSNVRIIGEETGGGAYGNTAWFIPDAKLGNTGIRFRVPRFRMVMDKNQVKNGRGIIPDITVKPTTEAIRRGFDVKLEFVRKLINDSSRAAASKSR